MKVVNKSHKKRRLRKLPCVILVVVMMLLGLTINGLMSQKASATDNISNERTFQNVTVQSGDTLWSLVAANYSYQGDIRKAVYEVEQINNIDNAIIRPGQVILIPVD